MLSPKEQNLLKALGSRIRKNREFLKISQEELADRAGVHRTYIGMIERAEKNITICNIAKIAHALNVKVNDLFEEI